MTAWSVEFTSDAEEDLAKIDRMSRKRIIQKLEWLGNNFDSVFPIPLHGAYREFYKLRVGDWRIFYTVGWKKRCITVCYIDRRDKVYKA